MYQFQPLDNTSIEQLAQCFNLAFSDYEQPMHFTPESMAYYIKASAVDLSLSFGAFCDREMVGFILNSSGIYNDQSVVFDAGTGVIPQHRGKKVFSALFDYTAQQLRQKGITKYYLEVLQSNLHAQGIYKKVAFAISREYTVLAASGSRPNWDASVLALPYQKFQTFETAFAVTPSFEHTLHTINKNPELYEVLSLENLAYCIYAKRNGSILQMHYNSLEGLKEVISALIKRYPSAWAKNIDCRYADVVNMFLELGFTEVTKQYEMVRDL